MDTVRTLAAVAVGLLAPAAAAADPPVRCLAFSPDGTVLVAGDGERDRPGAVTAYAVAGRRPLWRQAEAAGVSALSFAPDGATVAVANGTTAVLRLDAATGRRLGELGPHPKPVRGVAFCLDGLLATASDGTVRLWDVAAGAVTKELTGHPTEVRSLVASPTGRWLVSTGPD